MRHLRGIACMMYEVDPCQSIAPCREYVEYLKTHYFNWWQIVGTRQRQTNRSFIICNGVFTYVHTREWSRFGTAIHHRTAPYLNGGQVHFTKLNLSNPKSMLFDVISNKDDNHKCLLFETIIYARFRRFSDVHLQNQ